MKKFLLTFAALSVLLLGACSPKEEEQGKDQAKDQAKETPPVTNKKEEKNETVQLDDEQLIAAMWYNQVLALNAEDLETYMNTLALTEEESEEMYLVLTEMFETYDIEYTTEELKVLEINEDTAKIKTVQVARNKNKSEDFRDFKSTATHTLVKVKGEWKLKTSEHEDPIFLDEQK